MRAKTIYEAFDGVPFVTEAECAAYEKRAAHIRIVGLTVEQVEAALSGQDREVADAFEEVGARIRRDRYERGDLKRRRNGAGEVPATPPAVVGVGTAPQSEADAASGDGDHAREAAE